MSLLTLLEIIASNAYNRVKDSRNSRPVATNRDDAVCIGKALEFHDSPLDIDAPVFLSDERRKKHSCLVGMTGSGKTTLLLRLIQSDVKRGRSVCIIDLRGDLVDRILGIIAPELQTQEDIDRLHLLDLRRDDRILGFNPLSGSGEASSRALALLGVIQSQSDSWGVQLSETLRNSLIALSEYGGTLLDVERLLTDTVFREQVLASVTDPMTLSFFDRYKQLSKDKQAAWYLPVFNKITPLLSIPALRQLFGIEEAINIADILNTPGSIFLVSLGIERLHGAAQLIGGMMIAAIQGAVFARTSHPENKRNPVNLYVDEFASMASPAFEQIIAEGRRFRLSLTLAHQNLSQLTPRLRDVVQNNVAVQIFFQVGSSDARQLANEFVTSLPKEKVTKSLISQQVGEAFLIQRSESPIHFRVEPISEPEAAQTALNRLYRRFSFKNDTKLNSPIKRNQSKDFREVRHDSRPRI